MSEIVTPIITGAEAVVKTGAEFGKKALETAKKGAEATKRAVTEPARRMIDRIRPGRSPDKVLNELASMPTKKSEMARQRM